MAITNPELVFAKSKAHGGIVIQVNAEDVANDPDNYTIAKPPAAIVKQLAIEEATQEVEEDEDDLTEGLQPSGEAVNEVDDEIGAPTDDSKDSKEEPAKAKGKKKITKK